MQDSEKVVLPGHNFLDKLNSEQKEAVLTHNGPLLVLSGAGTGKTKVLTSRLANLIFSGKAKSSEILAVTFTNKAAFEMKTRVKDLINRPVEGMFIGTFHSIGARLLRKHSELVSLKSDFTILDTDDQIRLIKQVINLLNLDLKKYIPKNYQYFIDHFKNLGRSYDEISNHKFENFSNGNLSKIYELYEKRLKAFNSVDFGDLVLKPLNLFRKDLELLDHYQNKFKYILVDEYQDTNTTQYLLIRLLSGKHSNICCVGDEDQSIYGWRGAQLKNILNFEKDFPKSKIIRLEQNYRSTGNILNAASNIIAENIERIGKKLWTGGTDGEKVGIINVENDEIEALTISNKILKHIENGENPNQIAILTRASFQFKEIEDRFIKENIKYKVIGGLKFYERKEIKDSISYFRLMINNDDNLALERVINIPKRGIGSTYLAKMNEYARDKKISLFKALKDFLELDLLPKKVSKNIKLFFEILNIHCAQIKNKNHDDVAGSLLEDMGYIEMLKNDKTPEAEGRLENLKKLIIDIKARNSIQEFLEEVSLVFENISDTSTSEKISLMTLHSAKGLEFNHIFLPGWEEGIFPNQRSIEENGNIGLEEERRLAYVGITRARKSLNILYANKRKQYNQQLYQTIPSRFLSELPKNSCEVKVIKQNSNFHNNHFNPKRFKNNEFKIGDKVKHEVYGYGTVLGVDYKTLQIIFKEKKEIETLISDFVEKI